MAKMKGLVKSELRVSNISDDKCCVEKPQCQFQQSSTYLSDYAEKNNLIWDKDHPKIVIWSGGADSSLLLAETAIFCKSAGIPVHTITVNIDWLDPTKVQNEERSRRAFIGKMRELGYDNIEEGSLDIHQNLTFNMGRPTLTQQFTWEMISLSLCPKNSDVFFGFIKGDDVWHINNHRRRIFEESQAWQNTGLRMHDPYELIPKEDIYTRLHLMGLLEHTWTCESPSTLGHPCGFCHPCEERRNVLFNLAIRNSWAREMLANDYGITFEYKDWINPLDITVKYKNILDKYLQTNFGITRKDDTTNLFESFENHLIGCSNNRFRFFIWRGESLIAKMFIDTVDTKKKTFVGHITPEKFFDRWDLHSHMISEKGIFLKQADIMGDPRNNKPFFKEIWFSL